MHAVSIPAVGTDSIPMSKGAAFLPSLSLAGLCFNQLCELWLLDSAFPLVTVCLCVCEGVCDSVLNMPLLVVTSIKRGENGFHFHVVLLFAFSLCVSFFCNLFLCFEGGAWEPKIGFAPPQCKAFSCEIFPRFFVFVFFLIVFVWVFLFSVFCEVFLRC